MFFFYRYTTSLVVLAHLISTESSYAITIERQDVNERQPARGQIKQIKRQTCFQSSSASFVRPRIFARSEIAIAQL